MKSSHPDQYDIVFGAPPGTAEPAPEVKLMLEIVENGGSPALLKVFGVGGGGSNAVNRMIMSGLRDVEFWVSNTDLQALELSACQNRLPIGKNTTRGLGAGGDPEIGRLSAEEDAREIEQIIEGADMVFITAGMGGGTGTGAAPVIARIARELGVLTVGIVTKPFSFEGKKKAARARRGLEALAEQVDTLISIPNDKLMQIVAPGTSFDDALLMADDVLLQATRGISDLIMGHGIINLDFADVRTVMRGRGNALLGSGAASGDRRALEAAEKAVSSPLLEDLAIEGAEAVLVNIQGGPGMGFHEAAQAAQFVSDRVGEDADVFWGAVVDPNMGDEMRVTLVATGFPASRPPEPVTLRSQADTPASNGRSSGNGARHGHREESLHMDGSGLDDVVARPGEDRDGYDSDLESPVPQETVHSERYESREVYGEVHGEAREGALGGAREVRDGAREDREGAREDRGARGDHGTVARGAGARVDSRDLDTRDAQVGRSRSEPGDDARFERGRRQVEEARAASQGQRVVAASAAPGTGTSAGADRQVDTRGASSTGVRGDGRSGPPASDPGPGDRVAGSGHGAGSGRDAEGGRGAEGGRDADAGRVAEGVGVAGFDRGAGSDRVADAHRAPAGRPVDGGANGRSPEGRERRDEEPGREGADRRAGRSVEGGRLPERERRSPAESIALGASGLEAELFLPRDGGSDPAIRKSRWASGDPEWTEGDDLDRPVQKRRPLDVPAYLRRRMD